MEGGPLTNKKHVYFCVQRVVCNTCSKLGSCTNSIKAENPWFCPRVWGTQEYNRHKIPRKQDKQRLNLRRLNLCPRCSGNLEKSYLPQCQSSWLIACQKFAIVLIRNISESELHLITLSAVKQHVQAAVSISLPVPPLNSVTTLCVLGTITASFHFMDFTSHIVSTGQ